MFGTRSWSEMEMWIGGEDGDDAGPLRGRNSLKTYALIPNDVTRSTEYKIWPLNANLGQGSIKYPEVVCSYEGVDPCKRRAMVSSTIIRSETKYLNVTQLVCTSTTPQEVVYVPRDDGEQTCYSSPWGRRDRDLTSQPNTNELSSTLTVPATPINKYMASIQNL